MKQPQKRTQILLAVALLLYVCGYLTQFIGNYTVWQKNGSMLGAEIDFVILGIDSKSRSVVVSRREALKRCRVQSKYAGRVTDVHKGIVYVRLSNGVNAVAHSCYDRRTPGKKDDVSFVVTKLDEERSIAVGIITRIIRQNL